ncbi:hypothetical protein AB1Y20_012047 [Prymnesium parvum]|uniref:DDHD domain-containing protein n=1 Tax=Prymnesium parvum TaxID=97485 RepID=A0AB34IPH2_PRYPA
MASGRCRLHSGDHSSREVGYAWLQRRNSQWQRLQAHSERALNTIAASREKREATVALFGGRWEADLKLWDDINGHCGLGVVGSITSRYGEGPALPLARTRWCYRRGGGKWSPFSASHDAMLEETFRALLVSAATKAAVQHQGSLAQRVVSSVVEVKTADEGAYTVTLECDVRSGSVDAWMKAEDGGWVSRACYISRGWAGERLPQLSAEELAVEQAPCSALVLVIHGAGESFWRRRPGRLRGLCESVGKLRANAAAAVAQGMKQQGTPARRVEFLGIEWSQAIRGRRREGRDESRASSLLDPTSRLSRVSLASVPLLREFANEVILDVLFYEQAAHRQRIQRAVLDGIRALVVEWHRSGAPRACAPPAVRPTRRLRRRRHNPSFAADGGRVVLLGHSLGALICFDLLTLGAVHSPLQGSPSAFFALGSPIGCFVSLRGAALGRSFELPHCPRVYNLFHPHDPVAYRLEPLLVEQYSSEEADGEDEKDDGEEGPAGEDRADEAEELAGSAVAESDPWNVDELERAQQACSSAMGCECAWGGRGEGWSPGLTDSDGGASGVDVRRVAVQAVDYEEDWSTDQPAAAPAIAEVESSPVEPDVAGVLPPAVVPFSGVSRVESLKQAVSSVSSVSASDVARSVSSWLGFSKAKEEEELGDLREIEASREAAVAKEATSSDHIRYTMNEGGRVDYVLQSSKVEVANEYISALKAHSSYWSHPDVAAFVVKEIFALNQSTASALPADRKQGPSEEEENDDSAT